MNYYLGIDLGGTNVRIAKVDEQGNILTDVISPSYAQESAEKIRDNIVSLLRNFDYSDCKAIGIGVPGPVDEDRNVMLMASNIPALLEYPLGDYIEKETGLKVYMDNDANVAGLAEAVLGAGKGKRVVYYITHSTGIGGALIYNGKIISGRNGYAGEIGNIIVDDSGKKINHLNAGAAETEASGTAIGRYGKEIIGEEANSARKVFTLAKKGDEKACEIIDKATRNLAKMMQAISCTCSPDCYVIGGGCSHSSELYFDKLNKYLNEMIHERNRGVPIYKAEMKEPGVVGAAMLARSRYE